MVKILRIKTNRPEHTQFRYNTCVCKIDRQEKDIYTDRKRDKDRYFQKMKIINLLSVVRVDSVLLGKIKGIMTVRNHKSNI